MSWSAALWLFVGDHSWFSPTGSESVTRWWINVIVAGVIAGLGGLLRMRGEQAAVDASSARAATQEVEKLRQLAVSLGAAVSPVDVAQVVTVQAAGVVSAGGAALALVSGGDLSVVDPTGLAAQRRSHGDRIALGDSTLLSQAVREAPSRSPRIEPHSSSHTPTARATSRRR